MTESQSSTPSLRAYVVKNWSRFQTSPSKQNIHTPIPWIKLHRSLSQDSDFFTLSERARWCLILLWLRTDHRTGVVKESDAIFTTRLNPDEWESVAAELVSAGFLTVKHQRRTDPVPIGYQSGTDPVQTPQDRVEERRNVLPSGAARLGAEGERSEPRLPQDVVRNGSVKDDGPQSVGEMTLTLVETVARRSESECARRVFDYWRERTNHPKAQWIPKREKVLIARLREEPGSSDEKIAGLKLAVDGALLDPLFNGSEKGTPYLSFENLFVNRGRERVEKLQSVARRGGPRAPTSGKALDRDEQLRAFVQGGLRGVE